MKTLYITLICMALSLPCSIVLAQTPFDAFSPETSRIILDGDSIAVWRAEQQNQLSRRNTTQSRPDSILCALIADLRNEQLLLVDIATHRPVAAAPFTDEIKNWLSVDPLVDKNITTSPYLYCNGNPVMFIDPDGRDWLEAEDGTIQWTDCKSQDALNEAGITGTYLGKAVLDFQGGRYETLGWGNKRPNKNAGKDGFGYLNGIGAITAEVTLYGPGGKDDVTKMVGFTMTSDYSTFGAISEGWYTADYTIPGKTGALESNWQLTGKGMDPGYCSEIDGKPNMSPVAGLNRGKPWKTGVYIHACNSDGYAGPTDYDKMRPRSGISTGCLLLMPADFKKLNTILSQSKIKSFSVRVNR